MKKKGCSVLILAAGFSSRMKEPKFALKFDDERNFLEKIIDEYLEFNCDDIVVVLNEKGILLTEELKLHFPKNVKIIKNQYPEKERFYSLQIGLMSLANSKQVFIQNVDNPFVDQDILSLVYKHADEADYIVPAYKGKGGHPILVNQNISETIITDKNYDQNLKVYLEKFVKLKVECFSKKVIININNINDYNKTL